MGAGPTDPSEVLAATQWWTYRSTKAKRELGWKARPHEETLEATVNWHMEREHDRIKRTRRSQQLQYRVAGAALGAFEAVSEAGGGRRGMKRAFILAGGASRGAYQVGCLKALEEEGITPDLIVGSSIGVCNSLLYATGGAEHAWAFWTRAKSMPRVFGLR